MAEVDTDTFKETLGHFATGVTIVTAMEEGQPVGFTCQSFAALSLEPPMIAIAPAKSSTSWPRMIKAGTFCVNVLADHQEELCLAFAVSGGDKFAGASWNVGLFGAPILRGCLATVECALDSIHDAGDHELVIGRVRSLSTGHGSPLLFYKSRFTTIARDLSNA